MAESTVASTLLPEDAPGLPTEVDGPVLVALPKYDGLATNHVHIIELEPAQLGGSDTSIKHEHYQGFVPLWVASFLGRTNESVDLLFREWLDLVGPMDWSFYRRHWRGEDVTFRNEPEEE